MQRFIAALGAALFVLGMASASRADGGSLAIKPAIGSVAPVTALALLDDYRDVVAASQLRVKLPQGSVQTEKEVPGAMLTTYVEKVWSQARVYRRPGGAELILRGKF